MSPTPLNEQGLLAGARKIGNRTSYVCACCLCKRQFRTRSKHQKYCGFSCMGKSATKRVPNKCVECGVVFETTPGCKRKLCSRSCAFESAKLRRPILIEGDAAKVPLSGGGFAVVDIADIPLICDQAWQRSRVPHNRTSYAMATTAGKTVMMHRMILGLKTPRKIFVDHIDGDGLNNRRANLRECTLRQNQYNRRSSRGSSSKYKGVSLKSGKYEASITIAGKGCYLGRFESEEDAARAYDATAKKIHGKFARLNIPNAIPV